MVVQAWELEPFTRMMVSGAGVPPLLVSSLYSTGGYEGCICALEPEADRFEPVDCAMTAICRTPNNPTVINVRFGFIPQNSSPGCFCQAPGNFLRPGRFRRCA